MQPLTSLSGSFRARVVAARLESEGIEVELRGALDSPYVLTIGDLARVDVFVPEDQLEDARTVLVVDEAEAVLAPPRDWEGGSAVHDRMHWMAWVLLALIPLAGLAPVLRYFLV